MLVLEMGPFILWTELAERQRDADLYCLMLPRSRLEEATPDPLRLKIAMAFRRKQ
jgi:hypothetical protein